jgi:geranylgeranyl pyrophosphate synthase
MSQSAVIFEAEEPLALLLDRWLAARALSRIGDGSAGMVPWRLWRKALYAPLRDFLSRPGKAIRAGMLDAAYRAAGGKGAPPPELSLCIEALHAGSLIVDDVEDDSEERRGALALHRAYGVGTALNGGCWLYFWAFELLDGAPMAPELRASSRRAATSALLECHYGQALDLSARLDELQQREVPGVVRAISGLKTGGLVALSTELGALVAEADEKGAAAAKRLGRDVGVALQMLDDLSGITNDERRHKGHEDLLQCKPTWPWAWLAAELEPGEFRELTAELRVLSRGAGSEPLVRRLRALVAPIGKERVHAHVERALSRYAEAAPGATLVPFRIELERLERSYDPVT